MDGQRVSRKSTGSDVQDGWKVLTGKLVQVRDHEQKTLRSSVGGGERARQDSTVEGTSGTGLGVHLVNAHDLAEGIEAVLGGPGINVLSHWRRWRDWVDDGVVGEVVGHMGGCGTAVDWLHYRLGHLFC